MIDISVRDIVKSFDLEKKILDGVTFQIDTGGCRCHNPPGPQSGHYDAGELAVASGRRMGLISQIPVYPADYTVETVLRSAFARMDALRAEMDALAARMAQGDTDGGTLKRYGDLTARFEALGGYDTDTASCPCP